MPGLTPGWTGCRCIAVADELACDLCRAAARISAAFVKLKLEATDAPPTELTLGACTPEYT